MSLKSLPVEILFKIFRNLERDDLLSINKTCKWMHRISNKVIENKLRLHLYFPFPSNKILIKSNRYYENITLRYDDFIDEMESTLKTISNFNYTNVRSVSLIVKAGLYSIEFLEFIRKLKKLKQIRLIGRNKLLEKTLKEIVPLIIFTKLEDCEIGSVEFLEEIEFLTEMKSRPGIRCLTIVNLKTSDEPKEIENYIKLNNLNFETVEELCIYSLKYLKENTQSLLLFTKLKKLVINDWKNCYKDIYYIQDIYRNNIKTLEFLEINMNFNKSSLMPPVKLNLRNLKISYFANYLEANPFLIKSLKYQGFFLKRLELENVPIEELPFENMTALKDLRIVLCHWFVILSDDLHKTISKVCTNLEILTLKGIRSTHTDVRKIYKCPNLRKLVFEGDFDILSSFKAPLLAQLIYRCKENRLPDFKKFPKLRVLILELLKCTINNIFDILLNCRELEVLSVNIEEMHLKKVLNGLNKFPNLQLCTIICENINFSILKKICYNFLIYDKSFGIKENFKGVKIYNQKITILVTNGPYFFNEYYKNIRICYEN